ncbi:hypothetical protein SAMN05421636_102473 [Pricia antarctica]|uniref:Uncharacterized protein n=1 Tax=Pricia antarctica TaxID=641691 RepID=A0A1G6Z3A3_9FLAO|nr:hypothetical protein [Pricia antarctica]SDD97098.1 hypothetical protein SAMN05421636_102473 [Pricia antarctica]
MHHFSIPTELKQLIDTERTDFVIKSKRNYPKKKAVGLLAFATFWNLIVSVFWIVMLVPLFSGKEVHFTSNGVSKTASIEDWGDLVAPSLIIGLFTVIGISVFIYGIVIMVQKGGYFAGTPTRFIQFRNGKTAITDWEQFTGNIKIDSKGTSGNLEFELRTGKMQSRKNSSNQFVPDVIYLTGIENVFDIEKKCKTRIKENDPTPSVIQKSAIGS